MATWLQEIPWLTEEEKDVFEGYSRLIGIAGFLTRNEKTSRIFTCVWITAALLMSAMMVVTAIHFSDKIELVAYVAHHSVLFTNGAIAMYCNWVHRKRIRFILDAAHWSYNYKSEIIDEYTKKVIRERIKLLKFARNFIIVSSIAIVLEVQVFFILEVVYFKSCLTLFPIYVGQFLNEWPIYLFIVAWQETISCVTTVAMAIAPGVVAFMAWSHLDIEIGIMKFAISNVKNIIEEQEDKYTCNKINTPKRKNVYGIYCNHLAKHHASILAYFREFSKAMTFFTVSVFVTGFLITVAVGLSVMSDNLNVKMKLFGFLLFQLIVIYGWCCIGQNISDKGEEISELIVSADWWMMPKCCTSTLRLIMIGCTIPLVLTTPHGQVANNECFMDLMKGAYQMVNVLYQTTQR